MHLVSEYARETRGEYRAEQICQRASEPCESSLCCLFFVCRKIKKYSLKKKESRVEQKQKASRLWKRHSESEFKVFESRRSAEKRVTRSVNPNRRLAAAFSSLCCVTCRSQRATCIFMRTSLHWKQVVDRCLGRKFIYS